MATRPIAPLTNSPRYRDFISDRDKALELLLQKSHYKLTDSLAGVLQRTMEIISYWYNKSQSDLLMLKQLDADIDHVFHVEHSKIKEIILKLRRNSYVLSNAGEVEAISRATKPKRVILSRGQIERTKDRPSPSGGSLDDRIKLYLDRIKRKILDAVQLSAIQDRTLDETMESVLKILPKIKYVKRAQRYLKKPDLREADFDLRKNVSSTGFIDDAEWKDMIDEYQTDYIPQNRGPSGELDVQLGEGTPQYEWELEKEMTQDFVQEVRNGQNDAANQNGINDFIWISVIDDRTDECCVWRDGKTSTEIRLALQNDHADDECDAEVPPAHFNCRCTLAPMTDEMPETPPDRIGDFETWLNTTNS